MNLYETSAQLITFLNINQLRALFFQSLKKILETHKNNLREEPSRSATND